MLGSWASPSVESERFYKNVWKMLDMGGFLTSMEFLSQIASIISVVLTFLVGDLIANLFAGL